MKKFYVILLLMCLSARSSSAQDQPEVAPPEIAPPELAPPEVAAPEIAPPEIQPIEAAPLENTQPEIEATEITPPDVQPTDAARSETAGNAPLEVALTDEPPVETVTSDLPIEITTDSPTPAPSPGAVDASTACPTPCECIETEAKINCAYRNLTTLPTVLTDAYTLLDLSNNQIKTSVPTDGVDTSTEPYGYHVTDVVLNNNGIDALQLGVFDAFPNLASLRLSENNLTTLNPDTFLNNEHLSELILNHNSKLQIPATGSFLNLPSLKQLSLIGNNINQLPNHMFDGTPNIEVLNLAENPLDTELQPLNTYAFQVLTNLKQLTLPNVSLNKLKDICNDNELLVDVCVDSCEEEKISCSHILPTDKLESEAEIMRPVEYEADGDKMVENLQQINGSAEEDDEEIMENGNIAAEEHSTEEAAPEVAVESDDDNPGSNEKIESPEIINTAYDINGRLLNETSLDTAPSSIQSSIAPDVTPGPDVTTLNKSSSPSESTNSRNLDDDADFNVNIAVETGSEVKETRVKTADGPDELLDVINPSVIKIPVTLNGDVNNTNPSEKWTPKGNENVVLASSEKVAGNPVDNILIGVIVGVLAAVILFVVIKKNMRTIRKILGRPEPAPPLRPEEEPLRNKP